MKKSEIVEGLRDIKDFLVDGCCTSDKRGIVTDNDIDYFGDVIDAARDEVLQDEESQHDWTW